MADIFVYITPSMLVISIGGILMSLLGLMSAISKKEKTPGWIAWATFIAGLIIILGGVWSGIDQNRSDVEKSKLSNEILDLIKKNADLSREVKNLSTGGDSYCYIALHPMETSKHTLNGNIIHEGGFPLYDLKITIFDQNEYNEVETKIGDKSGYYTGAMNKVERIIDFGNLNPDLYTANRDFLYLANLLNVKNYDENKLQIFFSARNGTWNETIKLKKVKLGENNYWAQAIQVRKSTDIMMEYVDNFYPTNSSGKIDW